MAQFDVYENPSARQRDGFPYLVDIQSQLLAHLPTRLVMPLQRVSALPKSLPRRLSQTIIIDGEALLLAPQQCAALPASLLRKPIKTLASEAGVLRDALDAVISGV